MNKREKEVIQVQLDAEKDVLKALEGQYKRALADINEKIKILQADEMTQSKIYQLQYQNALKGQVSGILEKLHGDEYSAIQQYLSDSYNTAFVGVMYDAAGQGVPIIAPIDQKAAVKAILTDSKINEGLYKELGVDVAKLKKEIGAEITRGISTGLHYDEIARNLSGCSKAPIARAKTIVRTEGHRIQQASSADARDAAKARGCDVLKQWDSTLDGATRESHRALDGQIRETEEPFEYGGLKAMYPGEFGDPAEDCNCRCVALTRVRADLDEAELETLKERAEYFGLDKSEDFKSFEKKYLKAANEEPAKEEAESQRSDEQKMGESLENTGKSGIMKLNLQFFAEEDLKRQKTLSLKKAIVSFENRIEEHNDKINNPKKYVAGWDGLDDGVKDGLIKHWHKEISNFTQSIENRIDEIEKRGDQNGR